jgi:hypothetical protein
MAGHDRRASGWNGGQVAGLVLIGLGILFLLDTLGFARFVGRFFWPAVIVAIGVVVLLNATQRDEGASSASVPREGVSRLALEIAVGAGTFRFAGGASELLEVRSSRSDIATRLDREGDLGRVSLRQDVATWPTTWRGATDWEIRSASDIPTALRLDAGAGDFTLDLSAIPIVDARIQIGAAKARIALPQPRGAVEIRVTGGATRLEFHAPAGVEYRFESSGGLNSVDGRTETPGYATATDRVLIRFTGGASSIRLG